MVSLIPYAVHSRIHDFNPQASHRCLNRSLHNYFKELDFYEKVGNFILRNYEILGGAPTLGDFKRALYTQLYRCLVIGNIHPEKKDKMLTAVLINELVQSCYVQRKRCRVFIEGGVRSLNYWRDKQENVFAYLNPEIAEQTETWDIDSRSTQVSRLIAVYNMLEITKDIYSLFSIDEDAWEPSVFFAFMEQVFPAEYGYIKKNTVLQVGTNLYSMETGINKLCLADKQCAMDYCQGTAFIALRMQTEKQEKHHDFQSKQEISLRDTHMQLKIYKAFDVDSNTVNFYCAGNAHVHTMHRSFSHHSSLSKKMLCLIPRSTNTQESIVNSYLSIFFPHIPPMPEEVHLERTVTHARPNPAIVHHARVRSLLSFNLGYLNSSWEGNWKETHFEVWREHCWQIILYEIKMYFERFPLP